MVKAVIFLPAQGCSELYLGPEKIWPPTIKNDEVTDTVYSEGIGHPLEFMDPAFPLQPRGLVGIEFAWWCAPDISYRESREFFQENGFKILQKENDWQTGSTDPSDRLFFEYPYDWRQDLSETADRLNQFINTHTSTGDEICLVGHGMGGLLSREYLRKFNSPTSIKKQILVGTPNHGTPIIYSILKTGKGSFFANHPDLHMPIGLEGLFRNLPGIYQLLPDEIYGRPIVHVSPGDKVEAKIRGTYIASESTIRDVFYALNNDDLVNKALTFHNGEDGLNRKTFLEDKTYVIYSTELETATGVQYSNATKDKNIVTEKIGDGIVLERSAFDLEGLMTTTNRPHPVFTRRFVGIAHYQLLQDKRSLRCLLQLILE